jgi:hypothetical protein
MMKEKYHRTAQATNFFPFPFFFIFYYYNRLKK